MEKWELKCLNIKEENPHHQTVKRDASFFGIQSNTETIYTSLIDHNPLQTRFILGVCKWPPIPKKTDMAAGEKEEK